VLASVQRGGVVNRGEGVLCNFQHVKSTDSKECDGDGDIGGGLQEDQSPEPWSEETLGLSE